MTLEKFPKMQSGFKAGEVVVGEGWVWWGVRAQALQREGRGFDSWLLGGLQGLSKFQVLCACDPKGNGKCLCRPYGLCCHPFALRGPVPTFLSKTHGPI